MIRPSDGSSSASHFERDPLPPLNSLTLAMQRVKELPRSLWIELVRADQTRRWLAGQGKPVTSYLEKLPSLSQSVEDVLVLILGEVHLRREVGQLPTLHEYQQLFPDLASDLELQFQLDEQLLEPLSPEPTRSLNRELSKVAPPGLELLEELGRGSSGVVFRAWQPSVGRHVAVKIMRACEDSDRLIRQRREIQILGLVRHPHVVSIYDAFIHDERLHLVMELVEGSTLADQIASREAPPQEAANIVATLAVTLDTIHTMGVVHRDLKPSNVLMTHDGQLKISDFGAAKRWLDDSSQSIDTLLGTPSYMAPEQARGNGPAEPACDIYALGAILYELLTGRPPLQAPTVLETLQQVIATEPKPLRTIRSSVPKDLETICMKCLQKNPNERFRSARDLADELHRFLRGELPSIRRPGILERVTRICRRNRLLSGLVGALAITWVIGFAAVAWQWRLAEQQKRAAIVASTQAKESQHREEIARRRAEARELVIANRHAALQRSTQWLDHARLCRQLNRWDEAAVAYQHAIEETPDWAVALEERGQLYLQLGLVKLAADDLSAAFELHRPYHSWQWLRHALIKLSLGDESGYRETCEVMLESYPLEASFESLRATLLSDAFPSLRTDQVAVAEAYAKQTSRSSLSLFALAVAHHRAKNYKKSIDIAHESLNDSSWNLRAINYPILALNYRALGDPSAAHRAWLQAQEALSHWHSQMMTTSDDQWVRHQNARTDWPFDPLDWLEFQIYFREATALQQEVIPPDFRPSLLAARAFAGLRRSADALDQYDRALAMEPSNDVIRLERLRVSGYDHVARLQFRRACEDYRGAITIVPDDAALWRFLAIAHLSSGDVAGYEQVCAEMLEQFIDTDSKVAAFNLLYASTGCADGLDKWQQRKRLAEFAAAHNRTEYLPYLARAYYRLDDYEGARSTLEESAIGHPIRSIDLFFLAMIHAKTGEPTLARHRFAQATQWIVDAEKSTIASDQPSAHRPTWGAWTERPLTRLIQLEAEAVLREHDVMP